MVRFQIYGPMKFPPADIDPAPTARELVCRARACIDLLDHDIAAAHRRSVGYKVHQRAQRALADQRASDDGYHIEYLHHPGARVVSIR